MIKILETAMNVLPKGPTAMVVKLNNILGIRRGLFFMNKGIEVSISKMFIYFKD